MKCGHFLKIARTYKHCKHKTMEKMKTDLNVCNRDGDGDNPCHKQCPLNTIPTEELHSLHF